MIKFDANFYISAKGKITDFESCTFEGRESDLALEKQEKLIIPILEKMLKNNPKIDKKGFRWIDTSGKKPKAKNVNKVYFVEITDARWLESGSFKGDVKFDIVESVHNSYEFKKIGIQFAKDDAKALARPDKEEDYS